MKKKGMMLITALGCAFIGGRAYLRKGTRKTETQAYSKTKTIKLKCDSSFSKSFCSRLISFAKEQEKIATPASLFTQTLQSSFPTAGSVTIRSYHSGDLCVKVAAHKPIVKINNDRLLLDTGKIIAASDFKKEALLSLPQIALDEKGKPVTEISKACQRFLRRCDDTIHKRYAIAWYDDSYIVLNNKKDGRYSLVGDSESYFDEKLLDNCERVKNSVKKTRNSKGRTLFLDVRFRNQIIASLKNNKKGGRA